MRVVGIPCLFALFACSSNDQGQSPNMGEAGVEAGVEGDAEGAEGGAAACAPEVLFVVDRSASMALRPDGTRPLDTPSDRAESRIALAAAAVKAVTAAPADESVRFGLELFPPNESGCVTLSARITGTTPTNPACDPGELSVQPAFGSGAPIAAALDPDTILLCASDPLGEALGVVSPALDPQRKRYAVLLTDGETTCSTDAVAAAGDLASAGISLFVIAIGLRGDPDAGFLDNALMNELACAAGTARQQATTCTKNEAGTGSTPLQPNGSRLYYTGTTETDVETALRGVLGSLNGCGDGGVDAGGG
jgi:hypothetical protein